MNALQNISPIDGRYQEKVKPLSEYFSEYALIRYRVKVEIEYFIALLNIPIEQLADFDSNHIAELRAIYTNFSIQDAIEVKKIETVTNHDVKAVEYFVKQKFDTLGLSKFKEFIHFGLTSQDINNTAVPLSLKDAIEKTYLPSLSTLKEKLLKLSKQWSSVPMLARTHGQPASPTRLGKEIKVFTTRLDEQLTLLKKIPIAAKFGGATGNFNAHHIAYPKIKWEAFGKHFVEDTLALKYSFPTTQIEHYDHLAALFDALKRINNIVIDLNRDLWTYISMEYFKQKINPSEVGSSAMPHKVNPIDFENSEGNLGIANALFEHLSSKLPISRLQRDLTDSTVLRNIGMPIAHTLIGFQATTKGLDKLLLNKAKLIQDLEDHWAVVAEAIQTVLRREGYPNPYETLKNMTRTNKKITAASIEEFVDNLAVADSVKDELKAITPFNYTGI